MNNNTEVEILGLKDKDSNNIYIPDEIYGLPVTSIGSGSFINCEYIQNVHLPETLNSIGSSAFFNCSRLNSIIIPDSVTSIGSRAFAYCTSPFSIIIPDSVTSIGSYAFNNCLHLTIYCEAQTPPSGWSSGWSTSVRTIYWSGEWEYDSNGNPIANWLNEYYTDGLIIYGRSVVGYEGSDTNVVIPYGINSIRARAFKDCSFLTSIIIPDSVGYIVSEAFYNCTSLTIYCEAESRPSSWPGGWNISARAVYWGGEWEYDSNGNPYPLI